MGGGASDCNRCSLLQSDGPMWKVTYHPPKPTASHHIRGWYSLVYRCLSCIGQVYQPHPMQAHLHQGETEMMPQENIGSVVTQCPASKTSLGWINGKLRLLLWMSTGTSTEDG